VTPPNKTRLPRENVFIQIQDDPPNIKHLFRKNIFLLIPYNNTQSMSDSIYLYQLVILTPFSQSVPSSSSHSLLTSPFLHFPSTTYNFQLSSTALDIQQFLKPFTVNSREMCCHAVVIHTN